jgi:hypothetical protein
MGPNGLKWKEHDEYDHKEEFHIDGNPSVTVTDDSVIIKTGNIEISTEE